MGNFKRLSFAIAANERAREGGKGFDLDVQLQFYQVAMSVAGLVTAVRMLLPFVTRN